jgi:hypothetical protein
LPKRRTLTIEFVDFLERALQVFYVSRGFDALEPEILGTCFLRCPSRPLPAQARRAWAMVAPETSV